MDAKQIKSLLKQARAAITEKDFKTAIKHCKAILSTDKENYNAWVFIAVATQETGQLEQSETAFKRAIELCPDQLLAWQGLANFYEKQNEKLKQADALMQMLRLLTNDEVKQSEVVEKLTSLSACIEDKKKVMEIIRMQLELSDSEQEKGYEIFHMIFKELCSIQNLNPERTELRNKALVKIIESSLFSENDCKKILITCIDPLIKDDMPDEGMKLLEIIWLKHQNSKSCMEFLLKAAVSLYLKTYAVNEEMKAVLSEAQINDVSSWLCNLFEAVLLLKSKQYVNSLQLLKKVLAENDTCLEGWLLLSKIQVQLHLNKDAENSAKHGLKLAVRANAPSRLIGNFYLLLGVALSGSKCWENSFKALDKSMEYLGRSPDILAAFCRVLLEIELVDTAEEMCAELACILNHDNSLVLQLKGFVHLLKKEYSEALEKLRKSVSSEESAETLHLIGRVLWEMEEKEKSLKIFMKAAELDPFFSENFLFLGKYYALYGKDMKMAQLCYQKALEIDGSSEEAGRSLCNMLRALGDDVTCFKVLKQITKLNSPESCKWAWTQLGLYQLEKNIFPDAIWSLQNAVRTNPLSSYCWECLGDAYVKRGSYESALKTFEKACELNSKAMYPLYQISMIHKTQGMYVEAIESFQNLLHLEPKYIPGLIGLAESFLLYGYVLYEECRFGRAVECFQSVLFVLARVASINSNLLVLWKIAGDACTFSFHLGTQYYPVIVPAELQTIQTKESASCSKEEILAFGSIFYGRALSLKSSLSSFWHDLGVNYYFQSQICSTPAKVDFSRKAFACLQKATSILPSNPAHWTVLGITAVNRGIGDNALGQHAFIKSINIERNNAEAWTHLGIMYLENENFELANKSFQVAQSLDPNFSISWIGQAMIADKIEHSETIELYRHAATLCNHPEVLVGYGRTVCKVLLDSSYKETQLYEYNIKQMDAVYVAADYMQKYTANYICPEAFLFLGILLERQGLHNLALNAFERSVNLFEKSGKVEEIENSRMNYARLLSTVGQNERALKEYLKLKNVNMALLCSFAFALYRDNKFEKAFEILEGASLKCSISANKSHILVAMAMVLLKMQGSKISEAINLLVKSFQLRPPSVYGLLALRALGIMKDEPSLSVTGQQFLRSYEDHKEYSSSITLLTSIESYTKSGEKAARNVFMKAIRRQPDNTSLYMHAASCLLQWNSSFENIVATCVEIGVFHGGNKELASQIFALSKLAAGHKKSSLCAAQKAVHIQPGKLSNWVTLAAACHLSGKNRSQIGWIFSYTKKLAKEQGIKTELLGWLTVIEVFHYISSKNYNAANALLEQAIKVSAFSPMINSTLQVLFAYLNVLLEQDRIDPLVNALKHNPGAFLAWQLLINLLMKSEQFSEAEKTLSQFLIAASKYFPQLRAYPFLQTAVLAYKALNKSNEKENWIKVGEKAAEEAVKILPSNSAVRFLQGLIAVEANNFRLARRSFEKVIFGADENESAWMKKCTCELLTPIYEKKRDTEALQRLMEHVSKNQITEK